MDPKKIFKNLRLNDNQNVLIIDAPKEFSALLNDLKYDKRPSAKKMGTYDFVQIFASSQPALERLATEVKGAGKYDCLFWACYPKGTGAIKSDIKRETVWKAFGLVGLEAVTQIAIDDTWSALRGRPAEMVGH
jgi:hypothetical protein